MTPLPVNTLAVDEAFSPASLQRARLLAAAEKKTLDEVLSESTGLLRHAVLAELGRRYAYPVTFLGEGVDPVPDFSHINLPECRRRKVLIVDSDNGKCIYFIDPTDDVLLRWMESVILPPRRWELVLDSELSAILARLENSSSALSGALRAGEEGVLRSKYIEEISLARIDETDSPVVRLVNSTLYDALGGNASDIHLESVADGLVMKYRVDGVLLEAGSAPASDFAEKVISRIKVMAELDITERRIPQDGRFKARIRDRDIDFRVSIMPSVFGEDAVSRILDTANLSDHLSGLRLDPLGFDHATLQIIRRLSREPYGMLLVTGPTGSGKTTTLYAAISEINDGRDKIITIEDPVEYQVPGILQIPVNEKKGLTFARGLRSILRHDPDKVMVGEIRDGETAQIAIQAALTGHLVFSTIHANNVFDVLGRFEHMDVDPYSMASALNGIIAQRLVRINCPHCLEPSAQGQTKRRSRGCNECRGTGYKGRRAIGECLLLDDELREMIVSRAPVRALKTAARERGTVMLREVAEAMVAGGLTTIEEINRVTFAR